MNLTLQERSTPLRLLLWGVACGFVLALALHDMGGRELGLSISPAMIERYTIKFAPAVSHREPMKKLRETQDLDPEQLKTSHRSKGQSRMRSAGLKKIGEVLKELSLA